MASPTAEELTATVISAATPEKIAAACSAAGDPSNHSRPFFSLTFPALLARVFGFQPSSSPPWIDHPDPSLFSILHPLLSSRGPLLSSSSPVKFLFPIERLPDWMQSALRDEKLSSSLEDLSLLFKSRLKQDPLQAGFQLQLTVFEYFVFWFAYYPISRGKLRNSEAKGKRFGWAPSWMVSTAGSSVKKEDRLYLKLLREYLLEFSDLRLEFLVCSLVQFWLVGNDFSPLPGVNFQRLAVEIPPSPGLGEGIRVLLRHLIVSGKISVEIQRAFYRFLLRSFLYCPVETLVDEAGEVVSVWGSYLEPWVNADDVYSSDWPAHVTSNYLFYDPMFVHFLGFAHKILHNNPEKVVEMVLKVLNILTSSKELVDLLKSVYSAYHSSPTAQSDTTLSKLVPALRQQLPDWESGLCESEADGSFLRETPNRDLRLFAEGEDGARWLLQLFVLRAESEIRGRDGPVRDLDVIRDKSGILFRSPARQGRHQPEQVQTQTELGFSPKHPGAKYKGDWMRRPISEGEVAWLARLLVDFSIRLNEWVGVLDRPIRDDDLAGPITIDLGVVTGPREVVQMVLTLVACWLGSLGRMLAHYLRKRGARINLRPLASKKVILVFVLSIAAVAIRRLMYS